MRRRIVQFPGPLGRVFLAAAVIALLSPALASGARVAVFDDPAFVDTANTSDAESDNVQASLAALGHSVKTFTGTSAAAPQAAAAAVLLWSRDRRQLANQVRADLCRNAKHLDGFRGHRYDTGFGLVRLPDPGRLAESEDSSE